LNVDVDFRSLVCTDTTISYDVRKRNRHWGRYSRVVKDPLGETGRTPLSIRLPSAWGSVEGDHVFFPYVGGLLFGGASRKE